MIIINIVSVVVVSRFLVQHYAENQIAHYRVCSKLQIYTIPAVEVLPTKTVRSIRKCSR